MGNCGVILFDWSRKQLQHSVFLIMPEWWNGRHRGLKIPSSHERTGSSPVSGTIHFLALQAFISELPFISQPRTLYRHVKDRTDICCLFKGKKVVYNGVY